MGVVMTVSQLNRYISFKLKDDRNLQGILIRGEISNFTNHAKTGHFYFTLKDKDGAIKAIMFNSMASRVKFNVFNGMSVIVSANVQVFERDGIYQLYINDMQPDGVGAMYLAVEQLKEKLLDEGLFDEVHKKPLPIFPSKIGIVTSPDAAALQDILNILSRRYPIAEVIIFPCLVQGVNAAEDICRQIYHADNSGLDIIITGRGGGSLEDLMAFNDEIVARTIFECNTPIISAVGHETDTSISDYAADLRAPTPSAAAELAVPDIQTLYGYLNGFEKSLNKAFESLINIKSSLLKITEHRLNAMLPENKIKTGMNDIKIREDRLKIAIKHKLTSANAAISEKAAFLESLSPLKILSRGYSLVYKDDELIKSADSLHTDDKVIIKLNDGEVSAVIK